MKLIFVLAFVLATLAFGNASVSKVVKPVLKAAQPLTNGVANGLNKAAPAIKNAACSAGKGAANAVDGIGSIVGGAACGAGKTLNIAPAAIDRTLHAIDHAGLLGCALSKLL